MKSQNFAAIALAVDAMSNHSSSVGRTHIHKFLFLAESWFRGMPSHEFTLYRYGPYSFDLDAELQALRSVGAIRADADPNGYGARYSVDGDQIELARTRGQLPEETTLGFERIAEWLATKPVRALEAVATAEFVRQARPTADDEVIVERVIELKPHLGSGEVQEALDEIQNARADLALTDS